MIEPIAELLPSGRNSRLLDLSRYVKQFVRSGKLTWAHQYRSFLQISDPRLLDKLSGTRMMPDAFGSVTAHAVSDDPLLRLLHVDLQTQLPEALLLLSDKMTMATSLECRVPFLDHHLVELAARIPTSIKLKQGRLKNMLKEAVRDILPHDVIHRRKRGFGAPMGSWIQRELRPLRDVLLARDSIERRGMLAWPVVQSICDAHDANREDYTDLIMVLMNLEIWSRIFLDGTSEVDVAGQLAERVMAA